MDNYNRYLREWFLQLFIDGKELLEKFLIFVEELRPGATG